MLGADGNKPTGKPGQRKRKGEGKKAAEARKRKTVPEAAQQAPQPDQLQDTIEAIKPPVAAIEDATISAPVLATPPLAAATVSETTTAIEAIPVESLSDDSAASEAASTTDLSTEMSPVALAAIDWSPAASPEAVPVAPAEPAPVASVEPTPVTLVEAVSDATLEAVPVALMEAAPVAPAEIAPSAEAAPVSYQTIANAYGDLTRRSLDQTTSFLEKFWGVRSLDKVFELQAEFTKQACDNFVAESQRIRDLHRELAKQRLESWEGFVGMTKAR
jgi:hypothetical protein